MEKKYHLNYRFLENALPYGNTLLTQIGRRHCTSGEVVGKHFHLNWYEITVVIDGGATIITNEVKIPVSKGDIYLSLPGDFHNIISGKNPLKYYFFAFNTKNEALARELAELAKKRSHPEERVLRDEAVTEAVSFCLSEFSSENKFKNEVLSLALEEAIYLIVRAAEGQGNSKKASITGDDELCFEIMHYIDTNIYIIESLACLAEVFDYNYSYLSKLFKQTTGKTISDYYQTRRLDAAKLLLEEKKLTVSKIAEALNYSSLYSFSKAFKAKYGISPKGFEALSREKKV